MGSIVLLRRANQTQENSSFLHSIAQDHWLEKQITWHSLIQKMFMMHMKSEFDCVF